MINKSIQCYEVLRSHLFIERGIKEACLAAHIGTVILGLGIFIGSYPPEVAQGFGGAFIGTGSATMLLSASFALYLKIRQSSVKTSCPSELFQQLISSKEVIEKNFNEGFKKSLRNATTFQDRFILIQDKPAIFSVRSNKGADRIIFCTVTEDICLYIINKLYDLGYMMVPQIDFQ